MVYIVTLYLNNITFCIIKKKQIHCVKLYSYDFILIRGDFHKKEKEGL